MCCDEKDIFDDYDDCYDLDTIDELKYAFFDFDEDDFDAYWSKGWQTHEEGFLRFDADVFENHEYRVFPTRYRLKDFKLSKSLRRVLNKNRDLRVVIRKFRPTKAKDDLYTAHLQARFEKKQPRYTLKNAYEHLRFAYFQPKEVCVFDGKKLIACSIFETSWKGIFGSRAFWDVNEKRRNLGILTVLLEMQYAIKKRKQYYYLGHYFEKNPVYRYKSRFPACELWDWDNERWIDFRTENDRIKEMFNHRFRCRDDFDKDPAFTISLLQSATRNHKDIIAAALVGSRAGGTEREDSDYDLIIVTENPDVFFADNQWVRRFHRWSESKTESFYAGKTLRAFYKNGDVFEFNFVPPSWAGTKSLKEETRRIVEGGMRIFHDPNDILKKLQKAVRSKISRTAKFKKKL